MYFEGIKLYILSTPFFFGKESQITRLPRGDAVENRLHMQTRNSIRDAELTSRLDFSPLCQVYGEHEDNIQICYLVAPKRWSRAIEVCRIKTVCLTCCQYPRNKAWIFLAACDIMTSWCKHPAGRYNSWNRHHICELGHVVRVLNTSCMQKICAFITLCSVSSSRSCDLSAITYTHDMGWWGDS